MITTVSGLRVYVDDLPSVSGIEARDLKVEKIFYSRRGSGPIYRWLYEKKLAHWRVLRMDPNHVNFHQLNNTSWKSVPETLQAQLGQHYLD
ncbi:MAG TPA: hypothetical protein VIF64_22245 [Pyrinomonadaceae bacterium]|jgi:hypothetical protein